MDKYDDWAGQILCTIPPSDQDVRDEFVRLSKVHVDELRVIDPKTHTGDINVSVTNIIVPNGAEPEEVSAKINEAIDILESIANAAEYGNLGQSVLLCIYKEKTLYGFVLNPETGSSMQATTPILIPDGSEDLFLAPVILGVLSSWSKTMNAVVAWEAILILNEGIGLPDEWPER